MGIMYRCSLGGGGETCEFIAPDYDANKTDYAADDVVLKDGKVMKYNGSEWEDFSLAECTTLNSNLGGHKDYIFKNGAFKNNSIVTNGFNGASGIGALTNGFLELQGKGNGTLGRRQYIILQTPVDLTNFSHLSFRLKDSRAYHNFYVLLSKSKPSSYSSDPTSYNMRITGYSKNGLTNCVYDCNVSNLTGNYYITIFADGSSTASEYYDYLIEEIALD